MSSPTAWLRFVPIGKKNVEFGQNIGGVVIAEDEDEGDILTFAIDSQQERNSGSDTDPWRNSAPDQSNNTNRFKMKPIDRTVQFLMDADEGTGRQLYEFGTFEYRIMMEVTDNVVIDTLDIVIVLQDVNYAPVFQNCDVPRVALESDTNNGLGLVQPSVSSIEFIQDVVAVDNTQYLSFSSEYFAINPAWPSFANCVDCGFNLFPMLCCSTQIDNGVGGLNFEKTASHFTYSVSVIDSGPGTEQNSCLLKIYVANRNEAPTFSLTNVETVVNVEESTKVFSTIGKLVVLDPEINGVHDQFLTMTIVQQKMIINSVNEIIPIKFDTIVQSVNEEGRSIFYLLLVDSINFESNAGSFTISFKVEDDGEEILSDSISYAINVIDANEAPEQGFPGSVVFNLPENAFGGTEVGQVMRDEHFFDEDVNEMFNFHLYDGFYTFNTDSTSSCWKFNLDSRSRDLLVPPSNDGEMFIRFRATANGAFSMSFSAINQQSGTPGNMDKGKKQIMYIIKFNTGKYGNDVELSSKKTTSKCCESTTDDVNLLEETVLRSSSNFDVHPGIEEFLKSRYWIKLKSSFAILASALSVEIGNGNELQDFSPANAFNGELDQYFLSSCEEGFPTWVEQDFRTPKQVCGIGVHGNDRTLFPHTWKLQGAPHADAKTFEDIISIEEDGFFSACNKSTNECDSIGSTYHNIQPCFL